MRVGGEGGERGEEREGRREREREGRRRGRDDMLHVYTVSMCTEYGHTVMS